MYLPTLPNTLLRKQIVIVGIQRLGRKIANAIQQSDTSLPVAFCDDNCALWGTECDGLPIMSLVEAVSVFSDALFVVSNWAYSRTAGLRHLVAQLDSRGCAVTTFIPFLWRHARQLLPLAFWDLPERIREHDAAIRAAQDTLDADGRLEFACQLNLRLHADISGDPHPSEQYFPADLFQLSPDECFVDCGAFDGDTLIDFMARSAGAFKRYVALEPDTANFAALQRIACRDDRIAIYRQAAGARHHPVRFLSNGNCSRISDAGSETVPCAPLDDLLVHEWPSYIKMDIEGAELDALSGAVNVIRRSQPKLAICAYHHPDHLWRIPLMIRKLLPWHRITLRTHCFDGQESVYYAFPG